VPAHSTLSGSGSGSHSPTYLSRRARADGHCRARRADRRPRPRHRPHPARLRQPVPAVLGARGRFEEFEGSARLDGDDPSRSVVRLTNRADSIGTDHDKRDEHLRGGDFLDADRHPVITFSSTAVEPAGPGFRVTGDLTVRGVTRTVVLDLRQTGTGADADADTRGRRLGFTGRGVRLELDVAVIRQP
jgi:polyisoprenoid-binding protein YceI